MEEPYKINEILSPCTKKSSGALAVVTRNAEGRECLVEIFENSAQGIEKLIEAFPETAKKYGYKREPEPASV